MTGALRADRKKIFLSPGWLKNGAGACQESIADDDFLLRMSTKGRNPVFSVIFADVSFLLIEPVQKTFSCQFLINTALCASSGNLRAWEDL
ncbi:hypothetical protein ABK249_09610 [Neorhizobium sp. Rsf11]|uniref:Uncharacterized protein n=1 Tax=Neorhizobium phenanthreniclasticum TaxID=3157917 RepID=A0ABV0M014_9HYPH